MYAVLHKNKVIALTGVVSLLLALFGVSHHSLAQQAQKPKTQSDALDEIMQKWQSGVAAEENTPLESAIKVRALRKANDDDDWCNDILVMVSDTNGNPVPEALVKVGRDSFTSNEDGAVRINNMRPGYYLIVVTATVDGDLVTANTRVMVQLQKKDKEYWDRTKKKLPPDFNWQQYLANYPDLQKTGFDTEIVAANHYVRHGRKEGRTYLSPEAAAVDAMEFPSSVEPPPDFNWQQYVENYPDLQKAGIDTEEK